MIGTYTLWKVAVTGRNEEPVRPSMVYVLRELKQMKHIAEHTGVGYKCLDDFYFKLLLNGSVVL